MSNFELPMHSHFTNPSSVIVPSPEPSTCVTGIIARYLMHTVLSQIPQTLTSFKFQPHTPLQLLCHLSPQKTVELLQAEGEGQIPPLPHNVLLN